MIVRTVKVDDLVQVKVAMDYVNRHAERIGMSCLKQVLMTRPRTQMIRRTPLATTRRYKWYNRKDGRRTVNASFRPGTVKALRNAVQNSPVRETNDRSTVTFGAHAPASLGYAGYVHEARKPREGQYWHERMWGYGRGWTTQGTGNRFVEKAVTDNQDYIPAEMNKLLDRELRRNHA